MRRFLTSALLVALAALAFGDRWCFVVAGDGRTDSREHMPDPTGINTRVVQKLFDAINAEHPRFMLWTGDLIHGQNASRGVPMPPDEQYRNWKKLAGVLDGVTILPVRGNHETYADKLPNESDGDLASRARGMWLKEMKPVIDKAKVNYFAGEEGFSYSWSPAYDSKIAVIAVDQYFKKNEVNLPELEKALAKAKAAGAEHFFVFAHEMAFTCSNHEDNLGSVPAQREAFVNLLQRYNVRYFFAGHDHTYDWMLVRHKNWPKDYLLNQIVAGTAGAPFYPDLTYIGDHHGFDLERKEHLNDTYGYMLVEVDTDKAGNDAVTVTFKAIHP